MTAQPPVCPACGIPEDFAPGIGWYCPKGLRCRRPSPFPDPGVDPKDAIIDNLQAQLLLAQEEITQLRAALESADAIMRLNTRMTDSILEGDDD